MTTTQRLVCRGCNQELRWSKDGIEHVCHHRAVMRARHARMALKRQLDRVAQDIRTLRKEQE